MSPVLVSTVPIYRVSCGKEIRHSKLRGTENRDEIVINNSHILILKVDMNKFSVTLEPQGVALPEDPESCRYHPEYVHQKALCKILEIFSQLYATLECSLKLSIKKLQYPMRQLNLWGKHKYGKSKLLVNQGTENWGTVNRGFTVQHILKRSESILN